LTALWKHAILSSSWEDTNDVEKLNALSILDLFPCPFHKFWMHQRSKVHA